MSGVSAPTRRPGRPRGSRAGETKAELVRIALEAFAESGFRGTSLAKVATIAGLSQATVLHHFGSKDKLLADVLRLRDDLDLKQFGDPMQLRGWDGFERAIQIVTANTEREQLVRLYMTMAGEAIDHEHPASGWLSDHLQVIIDELTMSVRAGIEDGTIARDVPIDTVCRMFVAMLDGAQLQWLVNPSVDMVAIAREGLGLLKGRYSA